MLKFLCNNVSSLLDQNASYLWLFFPGLFSVFCILKQILQLLQQIYVIKSVYGAGIQTHDPQNISLLSLPLGQGSRPLLR